MNTLRPCLFQKGRICRILLFALSLLLYLPGLFAQESGVVAPPMIARLSGATGALVVGATANLTYPQDNAQVIDKKIVNVITLSIDEESASYIPEDFTATVNLQLDYGIASTPTDQQTIGLTVTYKKGVGLTYDPKSYFTFNNAQIVNVTVLSPITAPVLSNGLDTKTLLLLQNEMRVTRYYQLNSNSSSLQPVTFTEQPPAANPIPDELPVSWEWAADAGNNGTQLEWTWLDDDMISNYQQGNGAIDYDLLFKHNATRIDLPLDTKNYNIPLFYDGPGTLYYRVRAINYVQSGNRQDGPWSDVRHFAFGGHNNNLNWQAATTYAEEGKRKSVMNYFDGSMRMRQTVTKDNSTNTTLSAETFYDGQGRPAIQILPAPGMNNIVKYNENLNRFNGQLSASDDPALAFDLQPINGGSATDKIIGASDLYYSSSNPEKNVSANGNIPDAEGYPYTVTRYTPDGTGRIMSQSEVGGALKMGTGHEIKYYYGSAAPEELDGLFGTDAGNPTHYSKNMVKDANGQMSVSYIDMHGRTIATALAGDTSTGIMSIKNAVDYPKQMGTPMTRNLLNLNTNVVKGNSIEALNTILVPVSTAYQFTYKLNPEELTMGYCTPGQTACYDCMYDLEIAITDESGDLPPIIRKFTNVSLGANNGCNAVTPFAKAANETLFSTVSNNEIVFTETLLPGSYAVRKTLTISEASLQQQRDAFVQIGLCKTQDELIDSVYGVVQAASGCAVTTPDSLAPCQSCMVKLGSYATYRAQYILNMDPGNLPSETEIHRSYTADSLSCTGLCTTSSHKLDIIRSLMLSDMMPYTGQYAQDPSKVQVPHKTMYDKYDIFSTANNPPFYKLPPNAFQSTRGYYKDVDGNTDASIHDPLNPYQKLDGLDAEGFTEIFNPTWAESLLRFHPEYDRLVFAEQNLANSYDWMDHVNQFSKYSDAVGYIGTTGHPENDDPFFTTVSPTSQSVMANFVSGHYYQGVSMWQMAYGDVACKTITDPTTRDNCYSSAPQQPPFTSFSASQMDQAWAVFKSFYGTVRDSLINVYINQNKPLADDNDLIAQQYVLRFPTSLSQQITQYEWTGFPTTYGDAPTVSLTGSVAATTTSRCSSYIDEWKRELSQCPAFVNNPDSAAILTEITNGMETVCEKGLDGGNPYGSSTVPDTYVGSPRSFEEVVQAVFLAHGIAKDQYCHPFVIESPKPYGKNPVYTKEVITQLDTCNCKQFAKVKTAANEAGYNAADLESLNLYLKNTYNETLTQALFDGLQQCSKLGTQVCRLEHIVQAYPCNGGGDVATTANAKTATVNAALPPPSGDTCYTDYYVEHCELLWYLPLTTAQPKPAFLNCGYGGPNCLNCAQLSQLITDYKAYFNGLPCAAAPVLSEDSLTSEEISYNKTFALFANYRTGFQYNWLQYVKAANAAECNLVNYAQNGSQTQNVICASTPVNDSTGMFVNEDPCQHAHDMSVAIATAIYQQRKEQLLADFEAQYRAKCLSARAIEQFSVDYNISEYHYTLYYYDLAGNLVQTVSPKGARPDFSKTFTDQVELAKANGTDYTPGHLWPTKSRYNSLNVVVSKVTPDAGITNYWYDKLGRLAVSQNAQQVITPGVNGGRKYSYVIYDELGRTSEVGQKPQTIAMDQTTSQNVTALDNWINHSGEAKEQITHTVYDLKVGFNISALITQDNLRNQVSYVYTQNKETDPNWYTATLYSYDVAGNVSSLLQDYIGVEGIDAANPYKLIKYKYDLVSKKVNEMQFQPGNSDAFYHRYIYDAENRLVEVRTSRDNIVWERDAAYNYYKHGPLQRTVLGQLQTQGLDYTYTLQGWMKGVNLGASGAGSSGQSCPSGTALDDLIISTRPATNAPSTYTARNSITFDQEFANDNNTDEYETVLDDNLGVCSIPGGGGTGGGISEPFPVAQDAYTFSLHYFPGDYKPIDNTIITAPVLENLTTQATPLYNGNIAAMAVDIPTLGTAKVYNYHYDQLNRLKKMDAFNGLDMTAKTFVPSHMDDYLERAAYDPNGNITSYLRNGTTSNNQQLAMDNLTYNYDPNNNQLLSINDAVPSTNYTDDIDGQGANNYTYDKTGNLTSDFAGDISKIEWTVYGKIASITKSSGTTYYTYDATGNRITKTFYPIGDGMANYTIYVRDAQGNILGLYEKTGTFTLQQTEINLFGSNRLGMIRMPYTGTAQLSPNVDMGVYGTGSTNTFTRGQKLYELANHLGNVLVTISDKKIAVPSTGSSTSIDHYTADVRSAQDYYPFGMMQPGRNVNVSGYRYGFNGQERSSEVNDNSYTAEFWEYDSRIGRRWNLDPKPNVGISEYSVFANNPVLYPDLKGDSLPVNFYAGPTKELEVVPDKFQALMNRHFGIKIGYAAKSGLLYYDGDVKTDLPVSPTARKIIIDALTSTDGAKKSRKKYGILNIGDYGQLTPYGNDADGGRSQGDRFYMNLNAYNDDGSWKDYAYNGVPVLAQNFGRTFEHEWIAHFILAKGKGDGPERMWPYDPGAAEAVVNGFRREIGLEDFQAFNYASKNGNFRFYGNPKVLEGLDIKATLEAAAETLYSNYYIQLQKGESANPPVVKFAYIFKIPYKARNQ